MCQETIFHGAIFFLGSFQSFTPPQTGSFAPTLFAILAALLFSCALFSPARGSTSASTVAPEDYAGEHVGARLQMPGRRWRIGAEAVSLLRGRGGSERGGPLVPCRGGVSSVSGAGSRPHRIRTKASWSSIQAKTSAPKEETISSFLAPTPSLQ